MCHRRSGGFSFEHVLFQDGWAEPHLIKARAPKQAQELMQELPNIANRISKEDELPCAMEGIEKILKTYQEEHPDVLKSYDVFTLD